MKDGSFTYLGGKASEDGSGPLQGAPAPTAKNHLAGVIAVHLLMTAGWPDFLVCVLVTGFWLRAWNSRPGQSPAGRLPCSRS